MTTAEVLALVEAFLGGDDVARLLLADAARDHGADALESLLRDGKKLSFVGLYHDDLEVGDREQWPDWIKTVTVYSERERKATLSGLDETEQNDFVLTGDTPEQVIEKMRQEIEANDDDEVEE